MVAVAVVVPVADLPALAAPLIVVVPVTVPAAVPANVAAPLIVAVPVTVPVAGWSTAAAPVKVAVPVTVPPAVAARVPEPAIVAVPVTVPSTCFPTTAAPVMVAVAVRVPSAVGVAGPAAGGRMIRETPAAPPTGWGVPYRRYLLMVRPPHQSFRSGRMVGGYSFHRIHSRTTWIVPDSSRIPIPAFAVAGMVSVSSGNVRMSPDPTAAPSGNPIPSSVVVGAVDVYVFRSVPTAVAPSAASVRREVAAVPGVPAVVNRHNTRFTAVDVVLKTPISLIRIRPLALPTSAASGSVVDPAVVVNPATNFDISRPFWFA
jgi:hypothetical protein